MLAMVLMSLLSLGESQGLKAFPSGTWVDLTHSFDENTVYWPTAPGFELHIDAKGMTEKGYYYEANSFKSAEHGGTHLDAPIHFAEGKWTADEIPLQRLIGPVVVVDVAEKASADRDYQVSIADFQAWETRHGQLEDGVIVLLHTGFGAFWPDRETYMGTAERGEKAVAKLHFPGLHPEAAKWLVDHRKIHAIGLDTPSIDFGQSHQFLSHRILFEHNIPAFENVANSGQLPAKGALIVALPMKIKDGSGGPLRLIALVP